MEFLALSETEYVVFSTRITHMRKRYKVGRGNLERTSVHLSSRSSISNATSRAGAKLQ